MLVARRKTGHVEEKLSRLGGEIRNVFHVECAKYKFQQSFVLRAQESDLQARKAIAK